MSIQDGRGYCARTIVARTSGAVELQPWTHDHGRCVDHVDGGMPSIVLLRHRTGAGEVYGVRAVAHVDPHRHRVLAVDALTATKPGPHCAHCRRRGASC